MQSLKFQVFILFPGVKILRNEFKMLQGEVGAGSY